MRGLDPRIHQKEKRLSKKMDCRVKPDNDELTSEPALADQHIIAQPRSCAGLSGESYA